MEDSEFFGKIVEILDPDLYTVLVDIPGYNKKLPAFPKRGEVDEPRVGDVVFLKEVDPDYKSYYLYEKIKENSFIGIRTRGKQIKFSADFIRLGIHDVGAEYCDKKKEDATPEPTSWIKVDSSGNLEIEMEGAGKVHITADDEVKIDGNLKVEIGGNAEIKVGGNASLETSGNCDIKASGSCTIDSPDVKVTGASMTVGGTAPASGSGPFNCLKACIFSGCVHVGDKSLSN